MKDFLSVVWLPALTLTSILIVQNRKQIKNRIVTFFAKKTNHHD